MTYLQVSDDRLSVINGKMWCLVYNKDIKVGMGGVQDLNKQNHLTKKKRPGQQDMFSRRG